MDTISDSVRLFLVPSNQRKLAIFICSEPNNHGSLIGEFKYVFIFFPYLFPNAIHLIFLWKSQMSTHLVFVTFAVFLSVFHFIEHALSELHLKVLHKQL